MMRIVIYLFLFLPAAIIAQVKTDSIYTFPEVVKHSSGIYKPTHNPFGAYKYTETRTLNDALRENSGLYFKNYGNGQLSSISIRGTSAAQTDLLWNGVKLNSPSLGQVDVSLFNTGMSDQVELGGVARSGNVGGYINFRNDTRVDSGFMLNANIGYGSFNTVRTFGKVRYGNGRVSGTTRISYLNSQNNYPYVNMFKAGKPLEKLTNAKVSLLNFMQQINALINARNVLQFNVWLSEAQRQIPPVISKPVSKESQDDYSMRGALSWHGYYGKLTVTATSAFLHDEIRYRNPEAGLNEKSIMQASRNVVTLSYDSLGKFAVYGEVGYDYERAAVPAYQLTRGRHIGKMVAGVKYRPVQQVLLQLDVRQSIYNKTWSPFSPILALTVFKPVNAHLFTFNTSISRNYRFPTLNDLYWQPGGNPDLKTEKSCDAEGSLQYGYGGYVNFKTTAFCKYVSNWIQWVPTSGYWAPHNVKRVLTRGLEVSARADKILSKQVKGFNMAFNINYTYTRATNLDAISPADHSMGKQLIYVPLHVANIGLHVEYRKFYVRLLNSYTDAVFITTDNSQTLNGYYNLDIEMGKEFVVGNCEIGAAFRINNATNAQYQNIAQRPMPGRNFEGTLRFKFNR